VLAFYEHAVHRRGPVSRPVLIQHRNDAAAGADGLREFIERMRVAYPSSHYEIKGMFAEGDYVILHVHMVREPGARGSAHVDIFRLDNGKVAATGTLTSPYHPRSPTPDDPF
jgi:predicted SnoaL-like aldol condensation-catalyzing enzyme